MTSLLSYMYLAFEQIWEINFIGYITCESKLLMTIINFIDISLKETAKRGNELTVGRSVTSG